MRGGYHKTQGRTASKAKGAVALARHQHRQISSKSKRYSANMKNSA
jgi:hypothetical protein